MTGDTEAKYAKARRQQSQNTIFLLASVLLVCIAGGLLWRGLSNREGATLPVTINMKDAPALKVVPIPPPKPDLAPLIEEVEKLDAEVRRIKATGVIMEKDEESLVATKKLQEATRRLLAARYGAAEPYRVKVILEFQDTIPDFAEKGADGSILLEMAPSRLQPHSIYSFMEVARNYKGGAFHRIAGHVLQVMVHGPFKHLAFQEYSPEYPHEKGTVGYAGRPSGPAWYVSIQNNTRNHGPGSQQKHNPYEADSCFGKVIEGYDDEVQRISKIPEQGFISDPKKHVKIKEMKILVPGSGPGAVDGYVEYKDEL